MRTISSGRGAAPFGLGENTAHPPVHAPTPATEHGVLSSSSRTTTPPHLHELRRAPLTRRTYGASHAHKKKKIPAASVYTSILVRPNRVHPRPPRVPTTTPQGDHAAPGTSPPRETPAPASPGALANAETAHTHANGTPRLLLHARVVMCMTSAAANQLRVRASVPHAPKPRPRIPAYTRDQRGEACPDS
ncbi:hypothetical protein B0H17DRAFT_1336912 [Mycena rosella]|uniref:Uncharacterized protein n=1 Tax=Mycena rosella TaxID=1033263 RepID=A0AAD7CTZ6_MYCRO|nr:hypothetical protein B0H17DRAFT_1336912 [Mycena rosella]